MGLAESSVGMCLIWLYKWWSNEADGLLCLHTEGKLKEMNETERLKYNYKDYQMAWMRACVWFMPWHK